MKRGKKEKKNKAQLQFYSRLRTNALLWRAQKGVSGHDRIVIVVAPLVTVALAGISIGVARGARSLFGFCQSHKSHQSNTNQTEHSATNTHHSLLR